MFKNLEQLEEEILVRYYKNTNDMKFNIVRK